MQEPTRKPEFETREQKVTGLVREFYEIRKSQEIAAVIRKAPLIRRPIIAIIALIVCAAVWMIPTMVARGQQVYTAEEADRNARLAIYLASLNARTAQTQTGRAPANAVEARIDDPGIQYRRLTDSTFELSTAAGEKTISYHSLSDIALFLRSDSVLARKG